VVVQSADGFSDEAPREPRFNQNDHLPIDERLHLIQPSIMARKLAGQHITEFTDCEILVILKDRGDEIIDSFVIRVRRTPAVVHANVDVPIDVGGTVAKKLTSLKLI
jgi:hypothetical protein